MPEQNQMYIPIALKITVPLSSAVLTSSIDIFASSNDEPLACDTEATFL